MAREPQEGHRTRRGSASEDTERPREAHERPRETPRNDREARAPCRDLQKGARKTRGGAQEVRERPRDPQEGPREAPGSARKVPERGPERAKPAIGAQVEQPLQNALKNYHSKARFFKTLRLRTTL